ncbi:MAG: S41 family peptidase [Caldilineaceae bacterium]
MQQEQPTTHTSPVLFFRWPFLGAALLILALTFTIGAGTGYAMASNANEQQATTSWWRFLTGSALAESSCSEKQDLLYPEFGVFWEAVRLLYQDFYGELPKPEQATYAAIRGIVGELGDPNTSFMTPEEAEFFRTNLSGSFEGIGARVEWAEEEDTLRITEPFENQPAWKAGIRRGDLVTAVDGESLAGSNLTEAIKRIRGPKGTKVVLTIVRAEVTDPFDVEVVRDRIETPIITTDTLGTNKEIAYVKLSTFNQNSGQLVRQAVEDAVARKPAALIFDLRGNSGGLLREAVKVASVFLQDQQVLLERFNDGRQETYETSGNAVSKELPMVVLVNQGSASASEIVAGALQDHGRAQLLGVTTYGKGSVQLPHTLSNGAIMRVTIARWFTPRDRTIDGTGLEPDVKVEITEEDHKVGADPQLDAAVDLLEKEIGQ